ncbi:MAG: NADH-quinone oxidoreductase subunit J family protein [Infirmifilum sp.]|jgi:NADH-quinone oxidoreductase subunit J|uniref:NADH-quinone oxidoreductase subunit J family protein n=1 Tax=Infirmifilum TaxID=2856573 RepID=UPI00069B2502|nr:NADH-quinone oxidoreductase subunit J [Infirmifilum uzonense]
MSLPSGVELSFLLSSLAAIFSAVYAVKSEEDFYAAILLGVTGLSTASLIALLGYGFIGVFHALVYVGATVMFVVFGVVLIGRTAGLEKKALLPALLTSTLLAASLLALFFEVQRYTINVVNLDLERLGEYLFHQNPLAIIFLTISLAVLIVSGIMLASGDEVGNT